VSLLLSLHPRYISLLNVIAPLTWQSSRFALQDPTAHSLPHHQPPGLGFVCTFLSIPSSLPTPRSPPGHIHNSLLDGCHATTTTMNGMSRFLSRRDKHHEKRASKHANNSKVRLNSFASVNSLSPLLRSAIDTVPEDTPTRQRRLSSGIETLYHKLPSVLRTSVEDSFLFLNRQLPCRPSTMVDQTSTSSSSDYMLLQSSPPNVSPDFYRIFTSEGPRPPANQASEQKVCWDSLPRCR
jgi:hypothetical protein